MQYVFIVHGNILKITSRLIQMRSLFNTHQLSCDGAYQSPKTPLSSCICMHCPGPYFVLPVDPDPFYLTLSPSPLGVLSPTLRERKKHAQFKRQKIDLLLQRQFEIELRR